MPLEVMPAFLGGSGELAGPIASAQKTLNLIPEVVEIGGEPAIGFFRSRPGLAVPTTTLGGGPIRAMLGAGTPLNPLGGAGGRWFVVSGQFLYELNAAGVPINGLGSEPYRGSVDATGGPYTTPAILLPNGNQLGIVCGGQFWCDSGLGPVPIMWPPFEYADISVGWNGTCTTNLSGTVVSQISGTVPFNAGMVGSYMNVNGGGNILITAFGISKAFGITPARPYVTLAGSAGSHPAAVPFVAGLYTINSQASPFGPPDVGQTLVFTAAGPWTNTASFTILSVDAYGNATLYQTSDMSKTPTAPAAFGSSGGIAMEEFGYVTAASGTFLDSFFIVSVPNSKTFYVSAPNDGSTWDPTDNAVKESYPDNIGTVMADHQELMVMGESHTEVWQAPGANPIFPFQPSESLAMAIGIAAPSSACSMRDGPVWIGASLRGQPIAYFAQSFVPQRISTHAVEQAWASYTTCADAEAFIYELDGHEFWQISFPSGWQTTPGDGLGATWVYDRTASMQFGKPVWHEENSFIGGTYTRHRAKSHCYVFGSHWCGDFATGQIYRMSDTIYLDNAAAINCVRTFAHMNKARLRQFFQKLQLHMATSAAALTVVLTWSNDGGVTFVGGGPNFTYVTNGAGSISTNLDRIDFTMLGSDDDRVFSVSVSGNGPKTLVNAYVDVLQGIS